MLIEKLSQGEIAVKNDGTLEELREVIKAVCPIAVSEPEGFNDVYVVINKGEWAGYDKKHINLPAVSVKELYAELHPETTTPEWQPKWGEEVEVSDEGTIWYNRLFIGKHPRNGRYVATHKEKDGATDWQYIRSIQTLSLTLEEIAKKFGVQKVEIVKSKP